MAVLPVLRVRRRLHLDATCLVAGSMAPDFSYFVRGVQRGTFSHTWWPGLFAWGIPATLVIALVFHAFVKWPLLLVAPRAAARHLVTAAAPRWPARWSVGTIASCIASALVGAATHLAWDSFTHGNGFGARLIGARAEVSLPVIGETGVYRVLQYGSSLVGLVVVTIVAVRATRRLAPGISFEPDGYARATFAIALVSGLAASAWRATRLHPRDLDELLVIAISGLLAAVVVASAVVQPAARRLARSARH